MSELTAAGGACGSWGEALTWSEPRAHTCTPCFQKAWSRPPTIAGGKAAPVTLGSHLSLHPGPRNHRSGTYPRPPPLQSWGSLESEAPGPGPRLVSPASGTLDGGRAGTLRAASGLEKVIEGPGNTDGKDWRGSEFLRGAASGGRYLGTVEAREGGRFLPSINTITLSSST